MAATSILKNSTDKGKKKSYNGQLLSNVQVYLMYVQYSMT